MMEPPCRSTMRRQMARPRPRPSYDGWARWRSSNTWSWAPGGSPIPVGDADRDGARAGLAPGDADLGLGAVADELQCVAEQVVHDLAHQRGVGVHRRDHPHGHLIGGVVVGGHLLRQGSDVDAAQLERRGAARGPVEQVLDEVLHPAAADADPLDVLLDQAGLDVPVASSAAIISVQFSTAASGLRRSCATTSAKAVRSTRRACSIVASRKISRARARPVVGSRGRGVEETARIRPAPWARRPRARGRGRSRRPAPG